MSAAGGRFQSDEGERGQRNGPQRTLLGFWGAEDRPMPRATEWVGHRAFWAEKEDGRGAGAVDMFRNEGRHCPNLGGGTIM